MSNTDEETTGLPERFNAAYPAEVALIPLDEQQRRILLDRVSSYLNTEDYEKMKMPAEALNSLSLGDVFITRIKTRYYPRWRKQVGTLAAQRKWKIVLYEDPTSDPPAGYTDLYGYVHPYES